MKLLKATLIVVMLGLTHCGEQKTDETPAPSTGGGGGGGGSPTNYALQFDGSGLSNIQAAHQVYARDMTAPFTLEAFVKVSAYPASTATIARWKGSSGLIELGLDSSGFLQGTFKPRSTTTSILSSGGLGLSGQLSLNQTYHVAVIWDGTNQSVSVNGRLTSTSGFTTFQTLNFSNLYVGFTGTGGYLSGIVDDIRISNIARYSSDFTAPTSAFTNDASTQFLFHFGDGTANCLFGSSDSYASGTFTVGTPVCLNLTQVTSPFF